MGKGLEDTLPGTATPHVISQAGPTHTFLQDVFSSIFPLVLVLILIVYI